MFYYIINHVNNTERLQRTTNINDDQLVRKQINQEIKKSRNQRNQEGNKRETNIFFSLCDADAELFIERRTFSTTETDVVYE